MSKNIEVIGFPRNGNTFLIYAINKIYAYPEIQITKHTVKAIEKADQAVIPLRHPIGCLTSGYDEWFDLETLKACVKYYIRFTKGVLNNKTKLTILDFDRFTVDLEYIKSEIKKDYGIDPVNNPSIYEIKENMLENGRDWNLPKDNYANRDIAKESLLQLSEYEECLELYNQLKG